MKDTLFEQNLFPSRSWGPLTRAIACRLYELQPGEVATFDELALLAGMDDGKEFARKWRGNIVTACKGLLKDYQVDVHWLRGEGIRRTHPGEVADVVLVSQRHKNLRGSRKSLERANCALSGAGEVTVDEMRKIDQERNYHILNCAMAQDRTVATLHDTAPVYVPECQPPLNFNLMLDNMAEAQRLRELQKQGKS